MAGSAASSVLPASQSASGLRRSSRTTIKRVFSVDDLEVLQSTDNSLTDKPSGSYIVVNSNRRRKLKQQSGHISSQQSSQSQSITTPSHNDVTVQNGVGTAHCNERAMCQTMEYSLTVSVVDSYGSSSEGLDFFRLILACTKELRRYFVIVSHTVILRLYGSNCCKIVNFCIVVAASVATRNT